MTRFPPQVLREYALLADGQRGALCGPQGAIVWMCAPRWHDDAVFTALLGGDGGYSITPVERYVWGGRYEDRSLIWRHRWVTTSTAVECRDALAYPGDPHRVVLLRRIEAVEGEVRLRVRLDPRARFGAVPMSAPHRDAAGRWHATTGDLRVRWSGAPEAVVAEDGALVAELTVPAGGHHDLVLELGDGAPGPAVDADSAWRATAANWGDAVPSMAGTLAPRDAQQASAVLRGLTAPGGGMVAAPTMSLPERPEQGRNFDYRYTWVRDQCYAGIGVAAHGPGSVLADSTSFLTGLLLREGTSLSPACTVDGAPVPPEEALDLPGYPGGQDVVKGNWVRGQLQLDTFGELLQLLAAAARHDVLDGDGWRAMGVAADAVAEHWRSPEAGIWELGEDWWTHSRLSCTAGLRAAAEVSPTAHEANEMLALADAILAETSRRCLHPRGHWQRTPHDTGPDAALLLPPVRGALRADDPRTRRTVAEVRSRLSVDRYVYRFPQDPHPLGSFEGAFLLCGFVMALAQWQQGEQADALRWFERNRAACGPPGLFAEEYDVEQRQLRGNLPQAFVHAMLLECTGRMR
ncbi:glycoside hydrolase family 15 protein [Saccharopolyspora sp. CA-218241]|uniref:glycoside hydrolase family 15 protein n=1 Tax=Saccharopolyspora sp. CA-218241 TaxID=3240027 RepID=UPI003D960CCF